MLNETKRILVIGATGFIGSALTKTLLERSRGSIRAASLNEDVRIEGADMAYGDLNNPDFCRSILQDADVVYYLAGYRKNISFHVRESFEFFSRNVLPLCTFLGSLKELPPKKCIYVSSILVEYMNEDSGHDGYLLGKYASELALNAFRRQYQWDIRIVRSAAVYGPGDPMDPDIATFIPAIIRRISEADEEFTIWGNGERKLQFIYIDDLVENLIALLDCDTEPLIRVGHPESRSVNDVAETIMRLLKKNLRITHDLAKPNKPTNIAEFRNPVEPRVGLEEGLRKTIDHVN
jgi:GDP-L-fucose synthase